MLFSYFSQLKTIIKFINNLFFQFVIRLHGPAPDVDAERDRETVVPVEVDVAARLRDPRVQHRRTQQNQGRLR